MKIKAAEIKPGMVIRVGKKHKETGFEDICLITAVTGGSNVEYTHLGLHYAYEGKMVGAIEGAESVKVIQGRSRDAIIRTIMDEVFNRLLSVGKDFDMLRMVQEMDKRSENEKKTI